MKYVILGANHKNDKKSWSPRASVEFYNNALLPNEVMAQFDQSLTQFQDPCGTILEA